MDLNVALSIINMKLRDFYHSKEELQEDYEDAKELIKLLEDNSYFYNEEQNRYIKSEN